MNLLEKRMVDTLKDLKENHSVVGVKAEFEAEGTRLEEMLRLKEVCMRADLGLTIKIGGCEAIRDMYECRVIGIERVVAPMVESAYALKKFLAATHLAFPEDERKDISFAVNIETISACRAFEEMLALNQIASLDGIVMGRVDLTGSIKLGRDDINSPQVFEITKELFSKAKIRSMETAIGGGVSAHSLPFFRDLGPALLDRYETRKVIFSCPGALVGNAAGAILKAVGFELLWLKNKRDFYRLIAAEDEQRIAMLESRYSGAIAKAGGAYA
ncbi:MAG: citrate lyase beta subunit [Acidobacteria bacterium]|nr:citrate lyase beta subunit [Acidobacteriota bacterium]